MNYICHFIFEHLLGVPFRISNHLEEDEKDLPIFYGFKADEKEKATVPDHGLLWQTHIEKIPCEVTWADGLPYFFKSSSTVNLLMDHDLFSMCFYCLSRYEEYLGHTGDQLGRFQATMSLAGKSNFLSLPVIDLWVQRFADLINSKFDTNWSLSETYRCETTLDLDLPYAYKFKGWKAYAGIFRDILAFNFHNIKCRVNFWLTGKDPFNTYSWLEDFLKDKGEVKFFMLNSNRHLQDENHLADRDEFGQLIVSIARWAHIGVHPSLFAGSQEKEISREIQFIERYSGKSVNISRQHYLNLHFPDTYIALLACGIRRDYSMGYPDAMGFRAGTARPFLWFDLSSNTSTQLEIHPVMTMDATMRYYEGLSPDEALVACKKIKEVTRKVNGKFSFIWHNSSLSPAYGWGRWRKVFIYLSNSS